MADHDLLAPATRRGLHRAVAGGVAGAVLAPLLVTEEAAAAPRGGRKWHRCKVHKKHTCWHAKTCAHRRHRPGGPGNPTVSYTHLTLPTIYSV